MYFVVSWLSTRNSINVTGHHNLKIYACTNLLNLHKKNPQNQIGQCHYCPYFASDETEMQNN